MVESAKPLPSVPKLAKGDPNEFICGMPKSKYFKHTRKKAIVIAVSDYSGLRSHKGKEKYEDLNETLDDVKNIVSGLKRLGFPDDDILILKEPSWNDLHLVIIDLAGDIHRANLD